MKIQSLLFAATAAIASMGFPFAVQADTVDARCDIYPRGDDRASMVVPCTVSQRQGVVGIQLANGQRYDLEPVGDQPGNYVDQDGHAAQQESGLGDRGQIYRLADLSIYVYWDTAGIPSSDHLNSGNPVTYTTVVDYNHINIQITEGEFFFRGTLTRLPGPDYSGSDGQVRVILTPNSGRVVVFSEATGQTFYDYTIDPVYVGEDPATMCDPSVEPC